MVVNGVLLFTGLLPGLLAGLRAGDRTGLFTGLVAGLLAGHQTGVLGVVAQELLVGADGGDPAAGEQGDPVGEQHGGRAVGHDQRGGVGEDPAQRGLHGGLRVHVQRGQRVVQHEELGPPDHRAGQREPLPLAAGEAEALLADPGVGALRERVREVGPGDGEGPVQLRLPGAVRCAP